MTDLEELVWADQLEERGDEASLNEAERIRVKIAVRGKTDQQLFAERMSNFTEPRFKHPCRCASIPHAPCWWCSHASDEEYETVRLKWIEHCLLYRVWTQRCTDAWEWVKALRKRRQELIDQPRTLTPEQQEYLFGHLERHHEPR